MALLVATESSSTGDIIKTSASRQTFEACWLDSHICEDGNNEKLKDDFKNLSPLISKWHFFDTADKLRSYLSNNPNVKLITIMSGKFARTILALVSGEEALHSVYVLTIDIERNRQALGEDPKLKGIFNDEYALYDQLKKDLVQLFWNEGTRLAMSNQDTEARIYFDESRRLSSN